MSQLLEQWKLFVGGDPVNGSVPAHILESWRRSQAAGVDPVAREACARRLARADLEARLRDNAVLIGLVAPRLEAMSACLEGVPHAACLVDPDGVVLHAQGKDLSLGERGLEPGCDWSESRMGNNGLGTSLVAGWPVALLGAQHFRRSLHDTETVGAPLADAAGKPVGSIGLVVVAGDGAAGRLEMVSCVARIVQQDWNSQAAAGVFPDKAEFLTQLVHELRSPLATLLNSLQVIGMGGADAAAVAESRQLAARQVQELAGLMDDLSDIGLLASNKIKLHKQRVAVEKLVNDAVWSVQPLLDARSPQLSVLLPPEPLFVEGDPARLLQVLNHLLINAIRFTERGGHIWVSGERDGNEVLLGIRDTGIGLSAESPPGPSGCDRGDPPVSWARMRIELQLARSLVELHGGRVVALSDGSGEGSEFVVRLPAPAAEEPGASARSEAGRAGNAARPLRVLVVDDDIDLANSTTRLLTLWRHEARAVHEAFAALEVARMWQPEVIILDIGLPGGVDGFQVARKLRQEVGLDRTVIIAVTGFGWREDVNQSPQAADFDYRLVKPVDLKAFQALLADIEKQVKFGPQ